MSFTSLRFAPPSTAILSAAATSVFASLASIPRKGEAGFYEARDAMQMLIKGKEVRCVVRKREKYGRLLGECSTADSASLSDAMLANKLAVVDPIVETKTGDS
ncbi:thermonuclease family protein [Gemmata palustris]|uniref:thermonuclease family protein n=1 Tax=Gemmata palustris TaxID=2822762 RepID=UPI001FE8F5AB|nr:thermonuclease family protein [Gemmata palustris]